MAGRMPMERVDEAYETKMAGFEVDCADGKGEASACHYVAEFYAAVKEEYGRAGAMYAKNCKEKKYGPSCFSLGRFHLVGKGVPQDDAKALELFDQGCKTGLLPACYFQSMLLYTGLKPAGSVIDPDTFNSAMKDKQGPLPAAAAQSVTDASKMTPAQIAQDKKNKAEAVRLLDRTCAQGDSDSCYFLGGLHLKQQNPARDPLKAIPCLQRACENNHAPSCFNLAVLYNKGDTGVPKNPELFEKYKEKTTQLVELVGGLGGARTN